jgi:hypothetical protein
VSWCGAVSKLNTPRPKSRWRQELLVSWRGVARYHLAYTHKKNRKESALDMGNTVETTDRKYRVTPRHTSLQLVDLEQSGVTL